MEYMSSRSTPDWRENTIAFQEISDVCAQTETLFSFAQFIAREIPDFGIGFQCLCVWVFRYYYVFRKILNTEVSLFSTLK